MESVLVQVVYLAKQAETDSRLTKCAGRIKTNRFERIQNASFGNVSNASYQFVTFRRYNATLHG